MPLYLRAEAQTRLPSLSSGTRSRYYVVELLEEPVVGAWEKPALPLADEASLEDAVLVSARKDQRTIVTAESCTGGALGAALTMLPGSSDVYCGGVVSYSYELKRVLLGVSDETLQSHGAVSPQCAGEMAAGAARRLGGSDTIAITGIAGPSGATDTKEVGLVYMATVFGGSSQIWEFHLPGRRQEVRERSVEAALLLLLRVPRDELSRCTGGRRIEDGKTRIV
mgnify:CR=1 FL=1